MTNRSVQGQDNRGDINKNIPFEVQDKSVTSLSSSKKSSQGGKKGSG
jgi:hypothetical protein